ncbi:Ead domain protein [Klebsiella pneumoniae]|uniref:hypothetical protein n=1 Tax=Klebsiella pneumoniae TaxID=573 RepID=UPI0007CBA589|nr:Ead domain protein [Klebsiella pneumoniae]
MTTDITELAQRMKAAAVRAKTATEEYASGHMSVSVCYAECEEFNRLTDGPDNVLALVEALEKAQTINAAAEKLVRCKGRYHSEQNYRALAALFGVNTPDLPPLDDESHAVTVENLQESAYRAGLTAGWNLGLANNNEGFNKCLAAHTAGFKVKAE